MRSGTSFETRLRRSSGRGVGSCIGSPTKFCLVSRPWTKGASGIGEGVAKASVPERGAKVVIAGGNGLVRSKSGGRNRTALLEKRCLRAVGRKRVAWLFMSIANELVRFW